MIRSIQSIWQNSASRCYYSTQFSFQTFDFFMWTFSCIVITGPFSISLVYWFIGRSYFLNSLFLSTVRTIWGIAIAWIIFKSHNGEGGRTNNFLSNKYWMPVGKLGLSLYLVHPVLQYNFVSSNSHQMNLEATCMVRNYSEMYKAVHWGFISISSCAISSKTFWRPPSLRCSCTF